MAQPQVTRELAGLEVDLTNVSINSGYATCIQSKSDYQILDAAGENNLHQSLIIPTTMR